MASVGIPSVGSPTEENIALAEILGNRIAKKPRDWQRHLKDLLSSPDAYQERSDAVREAARPLTYENHAEEWIEAWNAAQEYGAKRPKKYLTRA
jgi:hypothetical protein